MAAIISTAAMSAAAGLVMTSTAATQEESPAIALSGEIDLARLVDFAAARRGVSVQYDAAALGGGRVTLRLRDQVTDEELWLITNQALAARGFAIVELEGDEADARDGAGDSGAGKALAIVRLADAQGAAASSRPGELERSAAGYVMVVTEAEHIPASELAEAIKPLLSKQGAVAQALGASELVLIADLRPKVDRALELLEEIDTPGPAVSIARLAVEHLSATQLVATASQITLAGDAIRGAPLKGKLIAEAGSGHVVVVAPESELEHWRGLVEDLDQSTAVQTHVYSPRHFGLTEVATLIEQSIGQSERSGVERGEWRVVVDDLTGSLIVTATPKHHEAIRDLMARLNATPAESRRSLRSFPVRHRRADELREMLDQLIASGAVAVSGEALESDRFTSSVDRDDELQRSERLAPAPSDRMPGEDDRTEVNEEPSLERSRAPADSPMESPLSLTVDEATNSLIAIGVPRLLDQLDELIRTLDTRQPQVMIEALVVSLNEGETLDLGVELEKFEISGDTTIRLASLFGLSTSTDDGRTVGDPAGGTAVVLSPGDFSIVIRALETLNEGRSLSVPKVLVSNNQTATLDSVLQQPFTQTNASDTVATTSFGGFENAGTTITITPQITKADHLLLQYAVALSNFVGESSDPNIPPPRQQNKLESIATIPDGYVVAVGGLEMQTEANAVSQVPLLGSIPIIGEAFKNRSKSSNRSRFFVFIRPTILRSVTFEDLKYLSDIERSESGLDDGFPELDPRLIYD